MIGAISLYRGGDERLDDEVEWLQGLLEACQQVIPSLESGQIRVDEQIAEGIRETCRQVERRLAELGVAFTTCFTNPPN